VKKLPEIKNSCADIYNLIKVNIQSNILIAAIKWKIFDYLVESVSAQTVAEKLQFHPRNTELFLNALAGMEIIQKNNGLFSNTEKSAEFLVSKRPEYLGPFFLHVHRWQEQIGLNMETLIENGPPDEMNMNRADGTNWADSIRNSAAYHYGGPVRYITQIIRSLPEFPSMKKMLDIGGGIGIYTISVVSNHPDMKGVVFEQPPVAAVAREFIREYDAEDRIAVMEGNYITDDIGDSYDLIFASATLNFYKDRFNDIFRKVYDALNPGGVFITHQDGIKNERTKPIYHISEFLSYELYGRDFAIEQGLIADSMLQSGFKSVRSFTKQSDFGDMDIDIGRK
jgi:SAM-dependent methyltransferase